jgi:hypothetical protein
MFIQDTFWCCEKASVRSYLSITEYNINVISLLVEETVGPREYHWPVAKIKYYVTEKQQMDI